MVDKSFAIIFAFLPSILWLLFFLFQDKKPEKKLLIVKTYILGAIIVIPVIALESLFGGALGGYQINSEFVLIFLLMAFIVAPLEEYFKYLSAKLSSFGRYFFDEPTDAVVYLITAALGFAGIENVFYVISLQNNYEFFSVVIMRGLLPVLLHALSSGFLGYFLALSFYNIKKEGYYKKLGFLAAITFHTIFNMLVYASETQKISLILIILMLILFFFAWILINRIKYLEKLKTICKIDIGMVKK
ncbi:Protease PrsW [bacterium HR34]|nr:Protease PrsW [bacterium HR34]